MSFFKRYVPILAIIFVLIQFHRPDRTNPVVEGKSIQVPDSIGTVLKRACYDCHSNETVWPWYSNVSPISIYLVRHVEKGRREVNFSEWQDYKPKRKLRKLKEIAEQINGNEMPMPAYLNIHTDAVLTEAEKKMICDWAAEETKKIGPQ